MNVHGHDLPIGEASRRGGVSEDLAWINKPLIASMVSDQGGPRAGRSSTVH
jgi:hypothetical protein